MRLRVAGELEFGFDIGLGPGARLDLAGGRSTVADDRLDVVCGPLLGEGRRFEAFVAGRPAGLGIVERGRQPAQLGRGIVQPVSAPDPMQDPALILQHLLAQPVAIARPKGVVVGRRRRTRCRADSGPAARDRAPRDRRRSRRPRSDRRPGSPALETARATSASNGESKPRALGRAMPSTPVAA